ncbi:B12-binding domain-containing radical SAM protein [Candidatus Cryosericum septentrionale]|uniref:Radical SAM protein n=1 Tax=Candidatus Cryosericum septentrionale TaxID=2290913 RepID=A0A398DLU6_9BACT|nr:radical SAM protein [Candidatus Cryosericum septentrionale]RIE15890.1 radical SAM protein [Candidatus Cryosericum septentrionale]
MEDRRPLDNRYSGPLESVDGILREFRLRLQNTFADSLVYLGTTTPQDEFSRGEAADIDVMLVFEALSDAHLHYVERMIQGLMQKYRVSLDTRLYEVAQLDGADSGRGIPLVNRFLLHRFLRDLYGRNPFAEAKFDGQQLAEACKARITSQQERIVEALSLVSWDAAQIRQVCQAVFDAVRAFLILENEPRVGKLDAAQYFQQAYPGYEELLPIYRCYQRPEDVASWADLLLDAYALVRHLKLRSSRPTRTDAVLLVNTPSSLMPHPRDDYLERDPNMPLGLVCIASYCNEESHSVSILDAYAENLGALSTVDRIFQDPTRVSRIIGFNCSSPNVHIVHRIAHYLKRVDPHLVVVCGGPHATLAPEHTLAQGDVEYAVVGEGEQTFLELVERIFSNQDIKGLSGVASMRNGRLICGPTRQRLSLDHIPLPDFRLLPLEGRYFRKRRRIYLHATRGCDRNCIFCSVPKCWEGGVRAIPMDLFVKQIQLCQQHYAADEFQIVDDNFSHQKGTIIRSFLSALDSANASLRWKCQARADQLDSELISLMALHGCFEIDLGIESGSQRLQKYIRKNLDLTATAQVVQDICDNGMLCKAFFMLGFPEETYAEIAETINYSVNLKHAGLKDVAFFPVMPFPGTEIAEITKKTVFQGAIVDEADVLDPSFEGRHLRKYSAKPEVSLNEDFTPDELRMLVRFAYHTFNAGQPVTSLKENFESYVAVEEEGVYGSSAVS